LGIFLLILSTPSAAYDDGDFQYWNTEAMAVKINPYWTFCLEEEFRFGDDAGELYHEHTDVGMKYSGFAKWLDVGLNYRGITEKQKGEWDYENRIHLNLTLKKTWKDIKLSSNSRLEFRMRHYAEDKPRYRNKTMMVVPLQWTKHDINPYLADEGYIDFDATEFTRNRVYAGFTGKIIKNIQMDLYYLLEKTKASPDWKETHILGTKIKVSF